MRREAFRDLPDSRAQGRQGEEEATEYLEGQGYEIVERNFNTRAGEIDAVAHDGETLCFIEVKARTNRAYGPAIEAVTPKKQRRLARAASLYLVIHPTDAPCRFDVLGMDHGGGGWSFTLIRDAFQVASR